MPVQATAITPLYNRCKRCHRKIKAPQEYGRICARRIKAMASVPAWMRDAPTPDGGACTEEVKAIADSSNNPGGEQT